MEGEGEGEEGRGTGNQRSLIFAEQKKKIGVYKRSKADSLVSARLNVSNKKNKSVRLC